MAEPHEALKTLAALIGWFRGTGSAASELWLLPGFCQAPLLADVGVTGIRRDRQVQGDEIRPVSAGRRPFGDSRCTDFVATMVPGGPAREAPEVGAGDRPDWSAVATARRLLPDVPRARSAAYRRGAACDQYATCQHGLGRQGADTRRSRCNQPAFRKELIGKRKAAHRERLLMAGSS